MSKGTGIFRAHIIQESDFTLLVLAKDLEHARDRAEDTDPNDYEHEATEFTVTSVREMTRDEVEADKTHSIVLKPTQEQLYRQAARLNAECDEVFMELIKGDNALTKKELRHLIKVRPGTWGRYSAYLETDTLKEDFNHKVVCNEGFEFCIGPQQRTNARQFQCMKCCGKVKEGLS